MFVVENNLIVAVDGGGSTCRVSICDLDGGILGKAKGGSANIATDFEGAHANIVDTIHRAYSAAGLFPTQMVNDSAYLGLAGANVVGVAERMKNALNFRHVVVTSDREITIQGAMGMEDGTVASIGTGSFFVNRIGGKTQHIGGWGFQIGDDCGGAYLGQKLLRRTIHAHDGLIDHSPLTRAVLKQFGGSPQGMVSFAQAASPMDYGGFSPSVIDAMRAGDPVGIDIVNEAVEIMNHVLDVLNANASGALYLLGGLGPVYQDLLRPKYKEICVIPKSSAMAGAIMLAKGKWVDNTA